MRGDLDLAGARMPRVHLIRHQEPAVRGVLLGHTNPPLSLAGRDALGRLALLEVNVVYTSPLLRARQTAEAICGPLVILPDLREISFGQWDGLTWEQACQRDPKLAERKLQDWFGVTPPEGEPWTAFLARVKSAWLQIQGGPWPCAVVAHQAVNAALWQCWTGLDAACFQQAYGEEWIYDANDQ